jgi:hypothetical protein
VSDDLTNKLNRVIRYADTGTVDNLLQQLNLPEHQEARRGQTDSHLRGITADALQDVDRDKEADLLRSGQHVVIKDGTVRPGYFSLHALSPALNRVRQHVLRMTGDDNVRHTFQIHSPDSTKFEVHHPDHPTPEVYPAQEAKDRLVSDLYHLGGMDQNGNWAEGWYEDTVGPEWKRLRNLILAVRDAPIEDAYPQEESPK